MSAARTAEIGAEDVDACEILCDVCQEAVAEWGTPMFGGGETRACGECVAFHAADRMEPGVRWVRLDGLATQTDGLVVIGGAA